MIEHYSKLRRLPSAGWGDHLFHGATADYAGKSSIRARSHKLIRTLAGVNLRDELRDLATSGWPDDLFRGRASEAVMEQGVC